MGREGIEPLVVHLTCFATTALQAAVRSTTRSAGIPKLKIPMSKEIPRTKSKCSKSRAFAFENLDLVIPWTLSFET